MGFAHDSVCACRVTAVGMLLCAFCHSEFRMKHAQAKIVIAMSLQLLRCAAGPNALSSLSVARDTSSWVPTHRLFCMMDVTRHHIRVASGPQLIIILVKDRAIITQPEFKIWRRTYHCWDNLIVMRCFLNDLGWGRFDSGTVRSKCTDLCGLNSEAKEDISRAISA